MARSTSENVDLMDSTPKVKLFFTGPFHEISKSHITLKNLTYKQLMYKIKTTEPQKYCVRPNLGIIAPQQTIIISVILQPNDESLYNVQGQHKFQILYTIKEDMGTKKTIEELWKLANPALIFHHKLRCFFETPEESEMRKKEEEFEQKLESLKDSDNVVKELKTKVEQLKQQNSKITMNLTATQQRLDIAQKPAQFPDLLLYCIVGLLGWLFAKFVI